ncbi:MAG: 2-C-methyl-D-erythritol 4-phosphate cytidylyltransferase [Planctomycetes bacterium]|nr:2-C-methyl-D-erythritol 4-phosphate cytidylyltransferase [Planctomycetota bacterium]
MTPENTRSQSHNSPNFAAVVPAAGSGTRMKMRRRKAFLELDGLPILFHSLARLKAARGCREICLAVHPNDLTFCRQKLGQMLREYFLVSAIVPGGKSRQESVLSALEATSSSMKQVLIHDAARPLVRPLIVEEVARRTAETGAAIAACRAIATVKEVDEKQRIVGTPDRKRLWVAHTPQGFHRDLALESHRRASPELEATDDASLVEQMNSDVFVVEDKQDNLKITTPEDLRVGEAILAWQKSSGALAREFQMPEAAAMESYPGSG